MVVDQWEVTRIRLIPKVKIATQQLTSQPAFTCTKLTIETPDKSVTYVLVSFIVNLERISHLVLEL